MSTVRAVSFSSKLPTPLTPLIGRERDIAAASALLRDRVRLLTLTGVAGVGKTRLAIATADEIQDSFAHGVVFVPLASVREPGLVLQALADAFAIRDEGNSPLLERLIGEFHQQHLLLVLDNFEHVIEAASDIHRLLELCPRLSALVTSRVRLRLPGEHLLEVTPLPVPNLARLPSLARLASNPAVALFLDRASGVDPTLALDLHNGQAIASICVQLEGVPLALELAATRLETLSPEALEARLVGRLTLLTQGPRGADARHRTLRDAITWSYELLSPTEQRLFRALSIFVGGCNAAAAEVVMHPFESNGATDVVLDGLSRLLDHNLIRRDVAKGEPRFLMLESIREFGVEQLAVHGEAQTLQQRHAAYYLALVSAANAATSSERERQLDRLEFEQDNLRAALTWATSNNPDTALRLATALQHFWMARGSVGEGRTWLDRALANAGTVAPEVRADALIWASYFAFLQDDYEQAFTLAEESLALWRSTGDARGTAFAVNLLGNVAAAQQNLETAIPFYEEALALHRVANDDGDVGGALANLGLTVGLTGDYARAASLLEEAITLCDSARDQRTAAIARLSLGEVVRMQGEPTQAALLLADALDRFQRLNDTTGAFAECWEGLAGVAATLDPVRAARLLGAADALRERLGHPLAPALNPRYETTVSTVRSALEQAVFAAAWEAGSRLAVEQAAAEARAVAKLSSNQETSELGQSVVQSHGLTPRELEVLRLVAAGRSDREIGAELFISRYTAMDHVKNIRAKLGVDSRAAVASYAVRMGLV